MKFFKQAFNHIPDEGEIGDCYRTCVAMLTGYERDEVPHFVGDAWKEAGRDDPEGFLKRLDDWLFQHRLYRVQYAWLADPDAKLEDALSMAKHFSHNICYMLGGLSRTGNPHVVICRNDEMIWDPSTCDSGIVGPMINDEGQSVFAIEFFVAAAYDLVDGEPISQVKKKTGFVWNDVYKARGSEVKIEPGHVNHVRSPEEWAERHKQFLGGEGDEVWD